MFLALHHSAHAATHVLVTQAMFLETARFYYYLFPNFFRPIQGENELGLLPLFLCFVQQNKDF